MSGQDLWVATTVPEWNYSSSREDELFPSLPVLCLLTDDDFWFESLEHLSKP